MFEEAQFVSMTIFSLIEPQKVIPIDFGRLSLTLTIFVHTIEFKVDLKLL